MLLINNTDCFPLNKFLNSVPNICNKNILEFMADGYCKYVNFRGKNKGKCCGRKLKKDRKYCFEHNYNINKNNKKNQSKIFKKIEVDVYTSITQLICYYNDKKDIEKINHIKISDKFIDNDSIGIKENPKIPLLVCFYNENTIFKDYIKKYKKKLKRKRQRKNKNRYKKADLQLSYENIYVKDLNNEKLIMNIDCGFMNIKQWPCNYESYKELIPYKIHYFHNYYNNEDCNKKSVVLFYKVNNIFKYKEITYSELYLLLINDYNENSVKNFIKKYYKEELSIPE